MTDFTVKKGSSWDDIEVALMESIRLPRDGNGEQNKKTKRDLVRWIIGGMKEGPTVQQGYFPMPKDIPKIDLWPYLRMAFIMRYPCCAMCGDTTEEIHHIRPREFGGQDHPRNLIALCGNCHHQVHTELNKGISDAIDLSLARIFTSEKEISQFVLSWVGEFAPLAGYDKQTYPYYERIIGQLGDSSDIRNIIIQFQIAQDGADKIYDCYTEWINWMIFNGVFPYWNKAVSLKLLDFYYEQGRKLNSKLPPQRNRAYKVSFDNFIKIVCDGFGLCYNPDNRLFYIAHRRGLTAPQGHFRPIL